MEAAPHYEVVVAGAGPAGCAAALVLHRAGRRVCLVDDAPASGFKAGEARRLLAQLGIAGLESLLPPAAYHVCAANASAWGSEHWTYQSALANPEGGGWHLDRAAFDAALRQHAAAGVPCYAARIAADIPELIGGEATCLVPLQAAAPHEPKALRASWLIDATGRRAYVSRRRHLARKQFDNQLAAVSWVSVPTHDVDCTTRIKSGPTGWWYTARLPAGRRVISFQGLPTAVAAYLKKSGRLADRV